MDVRCENCDKLFRVPEEKISGKGIKFACTRCGEYVQISKEHVEQDALAKTAPAVSSQPEHKPTPTQPDQKPTQDEPALKPMEASKNTPMEVRCENCSKLFRVPREKISGKGIKFACTRCGEYVIVAQDYNPEPIQANVAPNISERNPEYAGKEWKPIQQEPAVTEPISAPEPQKSVSATQESPVVFSVGKSLTFDQRSSVPEPVVEPEFASAQEPVQAPIRVSKVDLEFLPPRETRTEPIAPEVPTLDNFFSEIEKTYAAASDSHDALPREEPLSFAEFSSAVEPEQGLEPQPALEPEETLTLSLPSNPGPVTEPELAVEPQPEPAREEYGEPTVTLESAPAPLSMPQPSPMAQANVELTPKTESIREAFEASRLTPHPEPSVSEIVIQETVPAAPQSIEKKTALVAPFNWVAKVLLPLMAIIIVGVAGYALFTYQQASIKKEMRAASELLTIEGLLITNVTNSKDTNGDLVIAGTVQNTSDKQKTDWYLVIMAYNAQGMEIDKLRLLKGKQLHTRRDYEILAKRGVNVQDLKARNLEEQGIIIPAKGSVDFIIRYVQPPDSLNNLTPMLQTFDPVRLFKEIAEDNT